MATINSVISLSFSLRPLLFSQKGLWYDFEILHGLLTNKNIRIPILGGQKGKWAVDFWYGFEILHGLLTNKN